jgi:transcriptional regulator of heat shock response
LWKFYYSTEDDMSNLTNRNIEILKIIVEEFLETGEVLWSKSLLKKYDLWVSSATVRNDMATLENLELIYQPYNSAGRLPTAKWLRAFISYLMKEMPNHFLDSQNVTIQWNSIKTLQDFIYKITYELSKKTWEISFFISESNGILEYFWLGNFLEKNYKMLGNSIFSIIKMIEDKKSFIQFIPSLPINSWVNVFIGEENILPFLKDYTIIVRPIVIDGNTWYVWLIGWLKMNYNFSISAIKGII